MKQEENLVAMFHVFFVGAGRCVVQSPKNAVKSCPHTAPFRANSEYLGCRYCHLLARRHAHADAHLIDLSLHHRGHGGLRGTRHHLRPAHPHRLPDPIRDLPEKIR